MAVQTPETLNPRDVWPYSARRAAIVAEHRRLASLSVPARAAEVRRALVAQERRHRLNDALRCAV